MKLSVTARVLLLALSAVIFCSCSGQTTVSAGQQHDHKSDSVFFKKIVITKVFISEGVSTGDVNHDGKPDIMAGTFWFEAPDWKRHEIVKGLVFAGDTTFSNAFLNFSMDVNQDGWIDLLRVGYPGKELVWYENPKGSAGYWKMHLIHQTIGNESPAFVDMDGDGRPDILCNDPVDKKVIWFKSPAKGDSIWAKFVISSNPSLATDQYTHGLGYGDINGDGKKDVIITKGWWEGPADPRKADWAFHAADLGKDCAQMYIMDTDGDGDADVISSSAHNYGIWWFEQLSNKYGDIVFKEHEIDHTVSETHGLVMADINGDGQPDLITGKRYFAHLGHDPGAYEPSALYWFEFLQGSTPKWKPHLIDSDSGVGEIFEVTDINGDGRPDIIISNKKGVFIFEQNKQ